MAEITTSAEEPAIPLKENQRFCSKCRKTMSSTNFYTYKDGTKCELCKSCLTMHINNWEPDTFLWLLEKFDVPYIETEWNVLRDRAYAKDPYKMTGMSVFGKYLSKMKLRQWSKYSWADTERLKEKAEEDAKEFGQPEEQAKQQLEDIKKAYENGEISEAQYQTYVESHAPAPSYGADVPGVSNKKQTQAPPQGPPPQGGFYPDGGDFEQVELVDVGAELTQEDKVYLAMKWGRLYRADEWVALEQLYNEFMNSFDIQGAARIDTLKMICKTSLKMNQAIDCGDIDSYQKLGRVYDQMMKSAKFTEAQNKEGDSTEFDSVGAIVAFCEKEGGFIPEYEITADKDIIDTIIRDNREYLNTLVHNDTNLSQQIENFLKKQEIMLEQKADRQKAKEQGQQDLNVTDKDYSEFYAEVQSQKELDQEMVEEDE